jgi:hypothetical protein
LKTQIKAELAALTGNEAALDQYLSTTAHTAQELYEAA